MKDFEKRFVDNPESHDDNLSAYLIFVINRAIAAQRTGIGCSKAAISNDNVYRYIYALQSNAITPEEGALERFTLRKVKSDTRDQWLATERRN